MNLRYKHGTNICRASDLVSANTSWFRIKLWDKLILNLSFMHKLACTKINFKAMLLSTKNKLNPLLNSGFCHSLWLDGCQQIRESLLLLFKMQNNDD